MADTYNTTTTLSAAIKDLRLDIEKNIPLINKLQREYPLDTTKMLGRKALVPVILTNSHGTTRSKANNGAFTLGDSKPMVVGEAQIEPAQLIHKETVDYESVFRMENGQSSAHKPAVALVMQSMVDALSKEVEMDILYGQASTGFGKVNAATSASAAFVISQATWSGYWYGKAGSSVQISNAAWAADEDNNDVLVSVDPTTRTLTVTNAQTLDEGDLVVATVMGTSATSTVTVNGTPASVVYQQMAGFHKIITNTGTLFNISANTYPDTWAGSTVTVTGDPTFGKIMKGVSKVALAGCNKGLVGWVSPDCYERLNGDVAGARRFDYGYRHSKAESGAESLVFYGQTGRLRIEPHPYVMLGQAMILPDGESGLVKRYGSTDITFKRQGGSGEEDMAVESSGVAGFELRAYTGQQIFCAKPNWMCLIDGFTYS
jgi:hypothetical protein